MKVSHLLFLIVLFFQLIACNDANINDMGSSIQPSGDKIFISSETIFDIHSENYFVPYMYVRQDSFLLGTFYDEVYGTTHADIFAQVEPPLNHVYPPNTTPDSIILVMYYRKFFGDKYSPMNVSVYEMNKSTFEYSTAYPTNINPDDYVDRSNHSLLVGQKTFSPVDAQKKRDSTYITIKLSNDFLNRFSNIDTDTYSSEEKFLEFFKGLFITTDFGAASMLYVRQIDMEYYHHYTYPTKGVGGQDSTATVNSVINFAANKSVRQINRFLHPDTTAIKIKLETISPQIHYLSSPAGIYTRLKLPLESIKQTMESNGKHIAINNAKLRIDINEKSTEKLAQPLPSNILLIKESEYDDFFKKKALPSSSTAMLGSYAYEQNSDTGEYDYFYSFDIANLITNELKSATLSNTSLNDESNFLLVPVRVSSDANDNITEVTQQFILSAVSICGGNHNTKPIKARIIYSGF